jgi:hypothetical protein
MPADSTESLLRYLDSGRPAGRDPRDQCGCVEGAPGVARRPTALFICSEAKPTFTRSM